MQKEKQDTLVEMRSDILFQDVFNEKNTLLLTLLLSQLLNWKYERVRRNFEVKNIRLIRNNYKEKQKYCDYVIKIQGMYVIIELNNHYTNIFTRNETYAFSVINAVYGTDDTYYKKKIKTILFNLNWNEREEDKKRKEVKVYTLPRSYQKCDFLLKIVNINLDKYVDKDYNEIGNYEKLFKLFTVTSKKELIKLTKGDEYFELYCNTVISLMKKEDYKNMILSDIAEARLAAEEREQYAEQRHKVGIKEGRNEGLTIGRQEEKEKIISNMYNNNLSLNVISKCVNLSLDKVKAIIRKMTSK